MDEVSFSRSKISLISRFEWIISVRAGCCKRKRLRLLCKKTLHSGTELIFEFPKEWVITTKILFCRVSYCFCLFGEFAKVLERQVRVAHLQSAARALSSSSRCFQLSTNLDKDLFGCFLCWDARTIFTNVKWLFILMCFFHIVKLYTAKIKYTKSSTKSKSLFELI